jgi:hypothetical protein
MTSFINVLFTNNIRVVKSKMRLAKQAAGTGEMRNAYKHAFRK